jgi:transcriptional regulator with XRE-family HTH domain
MGEFMRIEILIRKIRQEKNMSLETLSKLSGISKGHLSKIERQERDPKLTTIILISKALKVDITELYKIRN